MFRMISGGGRGRETGEKGAVGIRVAGEEGAGSGRKREKLRKNYRVGTGIKDYGKREV